MYMHVYMCGVQLMRPGIGQDMHYTLGNLTPWRKVVDMCFVTMYIHVHVHNYV